MRPSQRLAELGVTLPSAARPVFKYVPVVIHGDVAYVSGQLPKVDSGIMVTGLVGATVTLEQAKESARICAMQALACLTETLGSVDRIARIIKLTGFVASAPGFYEQPSVIDAASQFMLDVFGDNGRHARSALGVAALPRNAPVELEVIAAIHA